MKKIHIIRESIIISALALLIFYLLTLAPVKKNYQIMPGGAGFDIYDICFSGSVAAGIVKDTNIVLVEVADDRNDIADQVSLLNKYDPKVIGVDVMFSRRGDELENEKLKTALMQKNNIVLGADIIDSGSIQMDRGVFDSAVNGRSGYLNFNAPNELSVVRSYYSAVRNDTTRYESFSNSIIKIFNREKYNGLLGRADKEDVINFRANLSNYLNISRDQLLEYDSTGQLEKLRGKIVLLGFFKTAEPYVLEDLHFTPMNSIYHGKSFPDMYGVVIHANIISMILNGDTVEVASKKASYLYAFILTFLFTLFILSAHNRSDDPKHKLLGIVQYLIIILVIYGFVQVFNFYRYKVFLEPIVVCMVLSLLFLSYYKSLAKYLNTKFNYQSVFTKKTKQ